MDTTTTQNNEATTTTSPLEQLEQRLKDHPSDFANYQALVEFHEKSNNEEALKDAYERILEEFPLMFGYWKKYAEFEDAHGRVEEAKQVFERGVNAVSTSVDLWTQYCTYLMSKASDPEETRTLFERAVNVAGGDYMAHKLWHKYLEFEGSQEQYGKVAMLYRRILSVPIKELDTYWEHYKTFAAARPLAELVASPEEDTKLNEAAKSHPNAGENLEPAMREILNSWREELYTSTSQKLQKISPFEQTIKRYYFHVQPLKQTQLDNWKNYLAFEVSEGQHDRIVRLFERCLETCAVYFEFWQRYVRYLESKEEIVKAHNALQRAATIFIKRRPEAHIALAEFEEQHDKVDAAQKTFQNLMKNSGKGHIESILRFVGFTRRQRGANDAFALFEKFKADVDADSVPFLEVQRAHFARLMLKQSEDQVRQLFDTIVQKHAGSRIAWMSAIEFELSVNNTDNAVSLFERALNDDISQLHDTDRLFMTRRYQDVAVLCGTSIATVRTLDAKIAELDDKLAKSEETTVGSKKRSAEEAGVNGDEPESKTQKADPIATAAAAETASAVNPAANAAWYGAYPQYYQQWYGGAGAAPSAAAAANGMTPQQQQAAYAQYYASASPAGQTPPPQQ